MSIFTPPSGKSTCGIASKDVHLHRLSQKHVKSESKKPQETETNNTATEADTEQPQQQQQQQGVLPT